jgi:hypothetical protein
MNSPHPADKMERGYGTFVYMAYVDEGERCIEQEQSEYKPNGRNSSEDGAGRCF